MIAPLKKKTLQASTVDSQYCNKNGMSI